MKHNVYISTPNFAYKQTLKALFRFLRFTKTLHSPHVKRYFQHEGAEELYSTLAFDWECIL